MTSVLEALEAARAAEKEQALFYRALAAEAERREDTALAEHFHNLHADEQHHLSRLTARLVELGATPAELGGVPAPDVLPEQWEQAARERERGEVARYRTLLEAELDAPTAALVREILDVELRHQEGEEGKWTMA